MAEKNNATCSICGKPYRMCLSCKDELAAAPWKIHTDTSEHYKVFQIIRGYSTGVYDKAEAKKRFAHVDLSDLDDFRDSIMKTVKDILAYEDVAKESPEVHEREKPVAAEKKTAAVVRTRKSKVFEAAEME